MLASFRSGAPLFTEALANSQNNAPYASKKTKTPAPADLQANPGLVQLTKFVSFNCGLHHTYSKSPPTRDRALAKAHSKSPLSLSPCNSCGPTACLSGIFGYFCFPDKSDSPISLRQQAGRNRL